MGYGPVDNNRFGWCWRDEHGSGRRMTPYFKTEELANTFHEYFVDNSEKVEFSKLPEEIMSFLSFMTPRKDLRMAKLESINKLAEEFENEEITINPVGETIQEFYGTSQMNIVGYEDPTPYPWEIEDAKKEKQEIEIIDKFGEVIETIMKPDTWTISGTSIEGSLTETFSEKYGLDGYFYISFDKPGIMVFETGYDDKPVEFEIPENLQDLQSEFIKVFC